MLEGPVMRSSSEVLVGGLCWRCYFLEKARDHLSQPFAFALTKQTGHGSRGNQTSIFDKIEKPTALLRGDFGMLATALCHFSASL